MLAKGWSLIVFCIITLTAHAEPPSFTPLGDLPGGESRSGASAVTPDGRIVVGTGGSNCIGPNVCNSEAFRWENGQMLGLGFPPSPSPNPWSGAQAVSADGLIIAGSSSSPEETNLPYRWENGSFMSLGRIPGYGDNAHFVTGMSDNGNRIVGWGYDDRGFSNQAWLWENGSMMGLGNMLPPGSSGGSWAGGISGDGSVIVGQGDGPNGGEAFRRVDGVMSRLGFLPSPFPAPSGDVYLSSAAESASYDGSVIAGSSRAFTYEGDDQTEAFRWSGGTMVGIGDLPDGEFRSHARAVSADGSVIVGDGSRADGTAAFIWDAVHGMRDLQTVLEVELGLSLSGWKLPYASDVSADGGVVVGTGINPDGQYEAYRAVMPEPATLSLLVLWGLVNRSKRRLAHGEGATTVSASGGGAIDSHNEAS